jgi:hypothetical protein
MEASMAATRGRIVKTPTKGKPYEVVLEHSGSADTAQGVATMREGEALIREETPTPAERDTSRDQPASDA